MKLYTKRQLQQFKDAMRARAMVDLIAVLSRTEGQIVLSHGAITEWKSFDAPVVLVGDRQLISNCIFTMPLTQLQCGPVGETELS